MDFKQLEAYVYVVDLGSFSQAAGAVNMSQPSVSAYISALERETGVRLILRSPKEAVPTEAGKVFYSHAKKLISLKEGLFDSMDRFKSEISGAFSIAASSVPAQYILPGLIAAFSQKYPDLNFHVAQMNSNEAAEAVSANQYEIGMTGAGTGSLRCEYRRIYEDELVLIAPNSSKYTGISSPVGGEYLYKLPFIGRMKGSGTSLSYQNALEKMGMKPADLCPVALFSDTGSVINAVARGLGVSIVSRLAAATALKHQYVVQLPTEPALGGRGIYLVYRKNQELSPASALFADFAESCAAGISARAFL